jgi:AraC family transcriptional regulator, regulatory protein of adaptative response / DNA-3-methyladenine glycosylase II
VTLDADQCYAALVARDARFDGAFFVAVSTTGIYCRPVCTARTPGRDRCTFYRLAALAERDGFRACFRCRPELAPGGAPIDAIASLAARAIARIDAGAMNDGGSVESLATELGTSVRHLRRAVVQALGVSPVELAQSRRLALAKQLLQDTSLPITDVAFAAGFASVRRFNALFQDRFSRPPGSIRREHATTQAPELALRLDYRPPLAWDHLIGFLGGRATAGVESAEGGVYRRTVRLGERTGWVAVHKDPKRHALRAEVSLSLAGALLPLTARLRRTFDLDARPDAIASVLGRDRRLRLVPGLRVPGAFDGFEMAVRAILGQQVSVAAATTLAGRLARAFGDSIATPFATLTHLMPSPGVLAAAGPDAIAAVGMPGARARAVHALAAAVASGQLVLDGTRPVDETLTALLALPGIGDWTAQYVAMRALAWPDAFPAGDLVLRQRLHVTKSADAERAAARWKPWRAYGVLHVWNQASGGG